MGLREDKKRATRTAIIDTSLALFRERGFDDTRVQDVADRLHISEGTFFNYFPTKLAVLEEVGVHLLDQAIELLEADREADLTVPQRLEASSTAFARTFEHDKQFAALLATHTMLFSPTRAARLARVHTLLCGLFAEGQARAEIRADIDAGQLADAFLAVSAAMVQGWAALEDTADSLEKRLLDATAVILWGCATG